MAPSQILRWIRQAYPRPQISLEWLDDCCEWVANELHLNPDTQTQTFIDEVEDQLLESDLRDSMDTGTGFPPNAPTMNNVRITGPPILVEVTSITEVGHSAFNLLNVRQAKIERADLAGLAQEQSADDDEGPMPSYPRSMLRLDLCDGTVTMPAIEYRSIPGLKLGETPLGYKIVLKDVLVRRGVIFLEPQGIVLKGHVNSERDEHRDKNFVRGLLKRMNKPIPTEDRTQNTENTESEPLARGSPRAPARAVPALEQVRSPLHEISEPPIPRPDSFDIENQADVPRKRRVPNKNPSNAIANPSSDLQTRHAQTFSSTSSTNTLVASRFFGMSSDAESNTSTEANVLTHRLARVLSPIQGESIDITDSSMEDVSPALASRSDTGLVSQSRKQRPPEGPGGSGNKSLKSKISYEDFDFDDEDAELDEAFLNEIAQVEEQALVRPSPGSGERVNQSRKSVAQAVAQSRSGSEATSRAASEAPRARTVERTPLPNPPPNNRDSSAARHPPTHPPPRPAPREVILIEDEDDDDDKENVPVLQRRVRRRISAPSENDDIIDLSD